MFVYVQVADSRLLKIECEPSDLVSSLKAKINQELGGNQPDEVLHSLNYLGSTLDCETPLSGYNIRESSLLYLRQSGFSGTQSPTQSNHYTPTQFSAKIPLQYNQYLQYSHQYQHQQMQPNQYPVRW